MSDYFQAIILLDPGCPIVKFLELLFIQTFLKLWADKLPRVSGLQFACATCQGLVINGTALYAILDEARLAKSFHPTRQNWEGLWMGVKLQGTRQKDMRPTGPQDSIGISQVLDLDGSSMFFEGARLSSPFPVGSGELDFFCSWPCSA